MRRLAYFITLSVLALLVLVLPAGARGQTQTQDQNAVTVSIRDFSFDPVQIAVAPGTTVTWVNEGSPHTVTADNGLFDSGVLNPGDSYSVWFDGSGTVTYHCEIHPSMTGSLTVGEGGGGTTTTPDQPPATPAGSGAMEMPMSSGY